MTLRLAAFQHFCGRFADAVLTSWSPLTYERGDYQDLTEAVDPDYEPTTEASACGGCDGESRCHCPLIRWERQAVRLLIKERFNQDSGAVPPAASVHPAAVDDAPPVSPAAGLTSAQLDWLEPAVLDVLANHKPVECADGHVRCVLFGYEDSPGEWYADWTDWREHIWSVLRDRLERASKPK